MHGDKESPYHIDGRRLLDLAIRNKNEEVVEAIVRQKIVMGLEEDKIKMSTLEKICMLSLKIDMDVFHIFWEHVDDRNQWPAHISLPFVHFVQSYTTLQSRLNLSTTVRPAITVDSMLDEKSLLFVAVANKNFICTDSLLNFRASPNTACQVHLDKELRLRCVLSDITSFMLRNVIILPCYKHLPLSLACKTGQTSVVDLLVAKGGANVNVLCLQEASDHDENYSFLYESPLSSSIRSKKTSIMWSLLRKNADTIIGSLIGIQSDRDRFKVVFISALHLLLRTSPTADKQSPLFSAFQSSEWKKIAYFMAEKVDNYADVMLLRDENDENVLSLCCSKHYDDCGTQILRKLSRNEDHLTKLSEDLPKLCMTAVRCGNQTFVREILRLITSEHANNFGHQHPKDDHVDLLTLLGSISPMSSGARQLFQELFDVSSGRSFIMTALKSRKWSSVLAMCEFFLENIFQAGMVSTISRDRRKSLSSNSALRDHLCITDSFVLTCFGEAYVLSTNFCNAKRNKLDDLINDIEQSFCQGIDEVCKDDHLRRAFQEDYNFAMMDHDTKVILSCMFAVSAQARKDEGSKESQEDDTKDEGKVMERQTLSAESEFGRLLEDDDQDQEKMTPQAQEESGGVELGKEALNNTQTKGKSPPEGQKTSFLKKRSSDLNRESLRFDQKLFVRCYLLQLFPQLENPCNDN
eukprot:767903-Hanusia_phi.AAC.16